MLVLALLVVAAHLVYALHTGVAYPWGPGWFPVRRTEMPFGYWASVFEFALLGVFFFIAALGLLR